jgi:uncharacterized membrane protein YfcA
LLGRLAVATYFLFFIATIVAGAINALAGGGGLIFGVAAYYFWRLYGPSVMYVGGE